MWPSAYRTRHGWLFAALSASFFFATAMVYTTLYHHTGLLRLTLHPVRLFAIGVLLGGCLAACIVTRLFKFLNTARRPDHGSH